jgi:hypothetical protein
MMDVVLTSNEINMCGMGISVESIGEAHNSEEAIQDNRGLPITAHAVIVLM